ncbi:MAG: hypothetical protein HYW49_04485 [Deltaproteobacteria bacterium]|nr:hypothetical protein [Deltaproteobacteria bacterium]
MSTKKLPKLLYHTFADWQALEIKGPDAKDFLQRMTTVDFRDFPVGSHARGTLLQATGKIVLYFHVLRTADQGFLLLVPPAKDNATGEEASGAAAKAAEAFEKFHFMEKFTIERHGNEYALLRVAGSPADEGIGSALTALGARVFELNQWTEPVWEEHFAFDIGAVVPSAGLGAVTEALLNAGAAELDPAARESFRVYFGEPAVPGEINSNVMPLEAGLEDTVPENKGCYPGQEVIEKIRAIGQVPRRIVCIHAAGAAPASGTKIEGRIEGAPPAEAGVLTSVATDPTDSSKWVGLGIVKKIFLVGEPTFTVDGIPVQVRLK